LAEWQLDELEDHLRTAFERHRDAGHSDAWALEEALRDLGPASSLAAEYHKVNPLMNPLSKLLGIVLSLAVIAAAVGANQNLPGLVEPGALALVTGLVLGGLIASFGPARLARTLAVGFGRRVVLDERERDELLAVVRRGYRLSWASGALGTIAGVIQTSMSLADPAQIGPAAALALFSLLYGALLAELVFGNLQPWVAGQRVPHA
jgi:hypothetical protein